MDVAPSGVLEFNPEVIGALVVQYTYDALGRVIRVQRPCGVEGAAAAKLDITDLYSDGVRVVQEVGWKNVPARPMTVGSGPEAHTYSLPRRANEMGLPGTQTTQTCGPNPQESDWLWADRRLEREYVYAADPGGYVDECIAQLVYTEAHEPAPGSSSGQAAYRGDDTSATILYVLSDHNMNVIGLANDAGGRMVGRQDARLTHIREHWPWREDGRDIPASKDLLQAAQKKQKPPSRCDGGRGVGLTWIADSRGRYHRRRRRRRAASRPPRPSRAALPGAGMA